MLDTSAQIVTSEEDSEDFTYGNHVSKHGVWETLPHNCDGDAFKHMARFSRDHKIPVNKAKDPFKQARRLADAYLVVLDLDLRTKEEVKEAENTAAENVVEEASPAEVAPITPVEATPEETRKARSKEALAQANAERPVDGGIVSSDVSDQDEAPHEPAIEEVIEVHEPAAEDTDKTEKPADASTEVVGEVSGEPVTEEQEASAEATEEPPVDEADEIAAALEAVEADEVKPDACASPDHKQRPGKRVKQASGLSPKVNPKAPQPTLPDDRELPDAWRQQKSAPRISTSDLKEAAERFELELPPKAEDGHAAWWNLLATHGLIFGIIPLGYEKKITSFLHGMAQDYSVLLLRGGESNNPEHWQRALAKHDLIPLPKNATK